MAKSSMLTTTSKRSAIFVKRLGRHHFSHLRAIAEGLDLIESAKRYLGVEHGHEAKTAHQQVVDAVRAVARRHNESAWRLIGLAITVADGATGKPSLEDFIAERDLDGWSESEVAEMYAEAYPADRKADRRYKLRECQLELIRKLEGMAAETPSPNDLVSGWFDDVTAQKLISAGMLNLGDLNRKVSAGGRWFAALPGVGVGKANRIASQLATLLPRETQVQKPVFSLVTTPSLFAPVSPSVSVIPVDTALPSSHRLLSATKDGDAIELWIASSAGSDLTSKSYRQQANRLLLWLRYERSGKTLGTMQVEDCLAFMAFLQNIPAKWISRERAAPGKAGWAPFRGPLSHKSQQQAITVIVGMFTWLAAAEYLRANPWVLLNKKTGDDKQKRMLDSKAFSDVAFDEILEYISSQLPSPSRARILFILLFVSGVGLRSTELLEAKLGDIQLEPEGWMMQVHGKGSKNRIAAIPQQAFEAMQDYLFSRNLGGIEEAPPHAPLLSSVKDPMKPIGYQALYETVRSWVSKAISGSKLPTNERLKLAKASTHWLRHTFGTRAVSRGVPLDVIQAQMGHASIDTTMSIYGRAPIKRRAEELQKAFGLRG